MYFVLDEGGNWLLASAGVEAILAVHRAVSTGHKWYTCLCATGGAHRIVHHPDLATVAAEAAARLGVLSQQEGIERIRAHIQIHQIAISALPIALPAGRAHQRSCQTPHLAELSFGGGVLEVVIALLADDSCRHWSLMDGVDILSPIVRHRDPM